MAKNQANVLKFVCKGISLFDTGSQAGYNAVGSFLGMALGGGNLSEAAGTFAAHELIGRYILVPIQTNNDTRAILLITENLATAGGVTYINHSGSLTLGLTISSVYLSPPGTPFDLGLIHEASLALKLVPIAVDKEAGGSDVQRGYEADMEVPWMETLLADPTFEAAYKNKICWLFVLGEDGGIIWIRNVRLNIETELDLSVKGKRLVKLGSKGYAQVLFDVYFTT